MENKENNFTDLLDDTEEDVVVKKVASREILNITRADIFSPEQCQRIRETIIEELWLDVKVVGDENLHLGSRQKLRGQITSFPFVDLKEITKQANDDIFDFDLLGIIDQDYPQIFKYTENQYYNLHVDINPFAPSRKISFIVNLSDQNEYEGGEINFLNTKMQDNNHMRQGSILIFPSFIPYEITPVTKGTKLIIVGHVHGAIFK